MKLKIILFFVFVINIFNAFFVKAFTINVIDYDPIGSDTDKEWFEICNDGPDISDFTDTIYKAITPGSSSFSSHDIKPEFLGASVDFSSGTCAAIVDDVAGFKSYKPEYSNKIFDSSFTLTNTGGYVGIAKDGNISICKSYGNGICPDYSDSNSTSTNSTSTNSTSTSNTNVVTNTVYIYLTNNNQNKYGDINVLLPENRILPAGADADFTVKVTDTRGQIITDLDFNWSFGDGGEKFGKDVTYHYSYPGEYTLIASADGFTSASEAKMKILVVNPNINISKVGKDKSENYIDLKNDTEYDLYLSDFYLKINSAYYKLPKKFFIEKGKIVHVSGEALGFKLPATNVSLNYPNKNLLMEYFEKVDISTTSSSSIILPIYNSSLSYTLLDKDEYEDKDKYKEEIIDFSYKLESKAINHNTNTIIMKRLIMNGDVDLTRDTKNIKSNTFKNNNINNTVDTGIINWFKSLIY